MNGLQTTTPLAEELPSAALANLADGKASVIFRSILFEKADIEEQREDKAKEPEFFRDLNLDQIVSAVTAGREEYNIKPFFYIHLTDLAAIEYRHEIMRDLENQAVFESIKAFSTQMLLMRDHLTAVQKRRYKYEKEAWFLDAAEIYCEAVEKLQRDLQRFRLNSRGLRAFRTYLVEYAGSSSFKTLLDEAQQLKSGLSAIRYCLLIRGNSITVRHYDSEIDYSAVVEEAFAKFKQGAVKDYRAQFAASSDMNRVEAQVLDMVAKLNPDVFLALDEYCKKNGSYLDKTIVAFDREIQFYIGWLEFTDSFKRTGLTFCYPHVSGTSKEVSNVDGFDLALALKLNREKSTAVCNDFFLSGEERIFIVTGPNQGGKTTFARTFGQLHYLASLGLTVAGTETRLCLFDRLFTHFEKEEDIKNLRGKLQDDLVRIHHILEEATPHSVIVINEIFSSTTLKDATYLGRCIMERISQLEALCVCVTFLDELASLNERTVSVIAEVVPDNPTLRTYHLERRPADGLAYALALAEKYGLTYNRLKERIKP